MKESEDKLKEFAPIIFIILLFIFLVFMSLHSAKSSYQRKVQKPSSTIPKQSSESKPSKKSYPSVRSSTDRLKSFNLSYEKRKEIYINFTEDPSYDLPKGYSKKMGDYRFKKYTERYNISEADILRILTEGVQKGW